LSLDVYTVRDTYFAIKHLSCIRNETRPYMALPELSALEPSSGKESH
jgi:hypothetical protein